MFPVATNEGGQCMAFPDVCKTPTPAGPVPIPYPNIAQCTDGEGSKKVKVDNKEVLRKGDQIRMSAGDEAGSAQGVASNKIKGKCEYMMGWPKVKAEGKDVAMQTSMTGQNCGSPQNTAPGVQAAPSQSKVFTNIGVGIRNDSKGKNDTYHPGESKIPPNQATDDAGKDRAKAKQRSEKIQKSEKMGDEGAKNAAEVIAEKDYGGLAKVDPPLTNPCTFHGAYTVDVVAWCADGTTLIMEAKGNGSRLGSAEASNGMRYKQGSPEYLREKVKEMSNSTSPSEGLKRNAAGDKIQESLDNQPPKVVYAEARTRNNDDGADDTVVKEFDP